MDLPITISVISVLVSVGAVAYARATVRAAEKANDIAIHADKLRTFQGVVKLNQKLQRSGTNLSQPELFELYDYFEVSEFYFTVKIYKQAKEFFDEAWEMTKQNDLIGEAAKEGETNRKEQVRKTVQHLEKAKALGDKVEDAMKAHLRLEV